VPEQCCAIASEFGAVRCVCPAQRLNFAVHLPRKLFRRFAAAQPAAPRFLLLFLLPLLHNNGMVRGGSSATAPKNEVA
jgi:hypothetical protein